MPETDADDLLLEEAEAQWNEPAPRRPTIAERFAAFHDANPHVYAELVRLCREWQAKGRRRLGVGMLWEVMRWNLALRTTSDDFKLNDHYRSRYARLIMERELDLRGIFETRGLRAP
jgi:hypothetical protein